MYWNLYQNALATIDWKIQLLHDLCMKYNYHAAKPHVYTHTYTPTYTQNVKTVFKSPILILKLE